MKTSVYTLVLVLAFVGNCLVVTVIRKNRRLRTVVNFFILNMAVSDLLTPLFVLPKRIHDIYVPGGLMLADGVFGSIICKFSSFVNHLSIFTLEIIAIERFFSVIYPMKKQPIHSKKKCFVFISGTWLVGAMSSSHNLYTHKIIHNGGVPYCISTWQPAFNDLDAAKVQWPISLILFTVLPFIFMTSLYTTIIISLHRQKANLHLASEETQRRAKKYRQVAYMLVTVVVVFIATWAPFNIYMFISIALNPQQLCSLRPLTFFSIFLLDTYPAINPFIYFIFNENYRKGFQNLLGCIIRRRTCCEEHSSPGAIEGNLNFAIEQDPSNTVVFLTLRSLEQ